MILLVSALSFKAYRENPRQQVAGERPCPRCEVRVLTQHDSYLRWVYFDGERYQIPLFRLRCRPCLLTCTLLPDFLIPYFRYSAAIVGDAVGAYFSTSLSYRSVAVATSGTTLPPGISVTDALLSIATRPSYQRVFAWVARLGHLGESYAAALLAWCLRARGDHDALHALAADVEPVRTKGVTAEKQNQLRSAVITRLIASRLPVDGLDHPGWIAVLGRFVARILGQIPWRAPPLPHSS